MSDGVGCKCFARSSTECVCDGVDWTPSEVITLRQQLAEAKKDAERYRWLANDMDGNAQDDFIRMLNGHVLSRTLFDEAIDQAMREGE